MKIFVIILLIIVFLCIFNLLLSKDKNVNYTPEIKEKKIPKIQLEQKKEKEMPLEEIPIDINEDEENEQEIEIFIKELLNEEN